MEIKNTTTCVVTELKLSQRFLYDFRGYNAQEYWESLTEKLNEDADFEYHRWEDIIKTFLEENGFVLKQLSENKELYQKEI